MTAFFDQADPVAAFFRGVQAWLGAPQTGVWDKATHDAFGAWAGGVILLVGRKSE